MKKTDLNYAAGLLDGEGSIMLTRATKGKTRSPHVSMTSTTIELLEFMQTLFGGHIVNKKTYSKHHKRAWSWQINYDGALAVCEVLLPYLKEPEKKRRAKIIVERYKSVTPKNGRYDKKILAEKQAFEREFFNADFA